MISAHCEDGEVSDSGRPPGRAALGMREMIGALAVLLVIVGVLAAVTRSCSFDPGAPAANPSTAPTVDASAKLGQAAASVSFPVRRPALPASWHANSSSTTPVGSGSAADVIVRVGWLTPGGRYVQLSQSGGTSGDVVTEETGTESRATGSESVGGTSFDTYPSRRDEVAWVAALDGAVVLITGNATEAEFRELATAVVRAAPLPRS
jgi:Protein of unknown function (DUF4245)